MTTLLLQVGKLLEGEINREGIFVLFLFFLMGAIILGFGFFVGYKAFKSKSDED